MRTEFGAERTTCACDACRRCCRFLPAWLIPADIERMIPSGADPFKWAELNLLASPGTLVAQVVERLFRSRLEPEKYERRLSRRLFRVPGLVLAAKPDGSCKFLSAEGACTIHDISPFGCAFFDGHAHGSPASDRLVRAGLNQSIEAGPRHLYHRLRRHLIRKGLVSPSPEVQRAHARNDIAENGGMGARAIAPERNQRRGKCPCGRMTANDYAGDCGLRHERAGKSWYIHQSY